MFLVMPKGKYLTEFEKGKINAYVESGLSFRAIGRKLKRSDKVIRNYVKNPSLYGEQMKKCRKSKVTKRMQRKIINEFSNSQHSLRKAANQGNFNISKSSIHNILNKSNTIVRRKMNKAPRLSTKHRHNRMLFARNHMNFDWSKVS